MKPMPPGMAERIRNNSIVQGWLVLMLTLFFGTALAGVQLTLGPKIEENKINETREKVPELILGKEAALKMAQEGRSLDIVPHSVVVEKSGKKAIYTVLEALADQKRLGWVIKSGGSGYADRIELLMGVDPGMEKISGIFILEQKETPGLGNKIVTDEWRGQFTGKEMAAPLDVVKNGADAPHEIDAVTGATISSKSVTTIINTAVADLKKPITAKLTEGK
jgi:electron transport complex protein RnfG